MPMDESLEVKGKPSNCKKEIEGPGSQRGKMEQPTGHERETRTLCSVPMGTIHLHSSP